MFGLFAKKAAAYDSGDNVQYNADGSMTVVPPTIVKIGGQEFVSGSPDSAKAFDNWAMKAKANGGMIQAGPDGAHYPLDSSVGKAELIKAELQIKHGVDPISAQKAVDQAFATKTAPAKFNPFFKKNMANDSSPNEQAPPKTEVAKAPSPEAAKAAKQQAFRGPKGPIA